MEQGFHSAGQHPSPKIVHSLRQILLRHYYHPASHFQKRKCRNLVNECSKMIPGSLRIPKVCLMRKFHTPRLLFLKDSIVFNLTKSYHNDVLKKIKFTWVLHRSETALWKPCSRRFFGVVSQIFFSEAGGCSHFWGPKAPKSVVLRAEGARFTKNFEKSKNCEKFLHKTAIKLILGDFLKRNWTFLTKSDVFDYKTSLLS